ncbi:MAG: hypothetical protein WEB88_03015 [Gemmatimonadota bacterium]
MRYSKGSRNAVAAGIVVIALCALMYSAWRVAPVQAGEPSISPDIQTVVTSLDVLPRPLLAGCCKCFPSSGPKHYFGGGPTYCENGCPLETEFPDYNCFSCEGGEDPPCHGETYDGTCGDKHDNCYLPTEEEEVEEFLALISAASAPEFDRLVLAAIPLQSVRINWARSAVQVDGCPGSGVVAHYPISDALLAQAAALD